MPKKFSNVDHKNTRDESAGPRHVGVSGASVESVAPRSRRTFSPSDKQRILKLAEAARVSGERGALESLMRREGIYSSQLSTWRQQFGAHGAAGLARQKPGRKPKLDDNGRELLALKKQNAKLEKKLHIANLVIDLQKKAHAILGIALPEYDEDNL